MLRILFLVFFLSCNGGSDLKEESVKSSNALEHLKQAKEILRQEEGQLMIMGRGFTEKEKVRYETLVDTGRKLGTIIDLLEKTEN